VSAPRDAGSGRPLLDRLGVKPGMRVALVKLDDPDLAARLAERGAQVVDPARGGAEGLDLVLYRVWTAAELGRLVELRRLIHDAGAIWVLREKGAGRTVRETDVIDAGRAFDLVDNKIASFSDTLAAMRLVVPLNQRRR
jgi:hypothetical protein